MPGLFERLRRTVDASGLPGIVTPRDEPLLIPERPSGIKARDDEVIASLMHQLNAANRTIAELQEQLAKPVPEPDELIRSLRRELGAANRLVAQLQEQLLAAQTAPVTDRHCANCPGLEQTIALLQDERRDLRKQLAGYQLAATRDQEIRPVSSQLP